MAYDPREGDQGDSWIQQGYAGPTAPPNHPWTGVSSPHARSFHTEPRTTGPSTNATNWSAETFVNTAQPLSYDQHQQYPQPLLCGTGSMVNNAVLCSSVDVGAYQSHPGGHYPLSQNYSGNYHLGVTYSRTSYPPVPSFNIMPVAHLPSSPSPISPSYPARSYSYPPSIADASVSPPGPPHTELQPPESPQVDAEYSVPCPYRCGTVLTGVHALGNLTRHLKTQACAGSSKVKLKYPCPIDGCGRQYARSDGLRVHMRRRHGAPPAIPRNDGAADEDED